MFLNSILGGVICMPLQQWHDSPYVVKLQNKIEDLYKVLHKEHIKSVIGCLHLMSDNLLYPELIIRNEQGETVIINIEMEPVSLMDLNLSDEEIKDIKANGSLIVSKFEG